MDWLTELDFKILHFIHDNMSCGFMDFIMPKITFLGEVGLIWLAAAVIMLFFKKYRRASAAIAGSMLGGLLVGNLALKHLVARARPCWIEPDFPMLIAIPKDFSFPSGHSMISFGAAVVIFHYNKKLGIAAFVVAALIAFSRLYLFVHFPSDVLVGTIIGIGLGIAAFLITDKIADNINKKKSKAA